MDGFMKIVNIIGGIGNQMFQYAFAVALKARNPEEEVLIDTSHFNGYRLHTGFELKRVFDVKLSPAKRGQIARLSYYIPHYTVSRALRRVLPVRRSEYIELEAFRYDSKALGVSGSFYFEGYSGMEIAGMLGKKESTVRSLLHRAKKRLSKVLGGEPYAKSGR
jgi:hypothetical protein